MENQQLIDLILASMQKDISSLWELNIEPEQLETLIEMRSLLNNIILKKTLSQV